MDGPITIRDAAPLLRNGMLTPSDLLEQCFSRMDRYEPAVQAWVYVDRERARQEAARLTEELKAGYDRGPLHGIPIGVKDIIDVFDMPTGCGSKLWADSYARQDAEVVANLRHAGALILGKTVTTPYAYLDPPKTRNPWNLERTPGGSSSGSAAAVACGMCLAALATQTGGSTIRPASYCGVYALKPTHGAISVKGVLPLAPSLDHVGIMANDIHDLAAVYQAITKSISRPERSIHLSSINGEELYSDPVLCRAVKSMTDPYPPQSMPAPFDLNEAKQHYKTIISAEAATFHDARQQRHVADYGPKMTELIDEGRQISPDLLTDARNRQSEFRNRCLESLSNGRFLLTAATPAVAPGIGTTGDPVFNIPWSFVGAPVIAIPAGLSDDGLPLGLQMIGAPGNDGNLLVAAAAFTSRRAPLPRPR